MSFALILAVLLDHWLGEPQKHQQGVLTRLFQKPASLRFGLPSNEQQWRQLEECVAKL